MDEKLRQTAVLVFFALSISASYSKTLQSSQAQALLKIQYILNFPALLTGWRNDTDFCNLQPSSSLTLACYESSITQLIINGRKGTPQLPEDFSIDSFVTTLVKLPNLKVLKLVSLGLWGPLPSKLSRISSLEILDLSANFLDGPIPPEIFSLTQLQTLIFDGNMLDGRLPDRMSSLSVLAVLSAKDNSLSGPLPVSLGNLENLRVLALSNNNFSGEVPDLRNVENLQVLDLGNNSLGPQFPLVSNKIVTLVIRMNKFSYGIPENVQYYYQLEHLDISSNKFVGPFPTFLLSMPSINYLNIGANRFTGMLFEDLICSDELKFVNFSANLLTGKLPSCLKSVEKVVQYAGNCLATADQSQHPLNFCQNGALAVGILPHSNRRKHVSQVALALSISGSVVGGIVLVSLVIVLLRKFTGKEATNKIPTRTIEEYASTGYTSNSKILSDARYMTQSMKLGPVGLPAFRTFSLEELREATNNFDTSCFMGEGSHGQMYRGQLRDGSSVAIRCLKMKRNHSTQNLMCHIETISKLRHHHLASAFGYCFECYLDDSSVSRMFLVFEYAPSGNLRRWISEKGARLTLSWTQRIAAAIGVAKGIQFLHTGIVPGVYANCLKITDILLDQNLVGKISSYNLPFLSENMEKDVVRRYFPSTSKEPRHARVKHQDKFDIHDFGVILLEIISGKPINSKNDVIVLRDQMQYDKLQKLHFLTLPVLIVSAGMLQSSIIAGAAARRRVVDPAVSNACSEESVKTMIEICCRCLLKDPADRPSIEDVLWNLQFAAQVQDAWRGDSQSSDSSPVSSFQAPSLQLTVPWQ